MFRLANDKGGLFGVIGDGAAISDMHFRPLHWDEESWFLDIKFTHARAQGVQFRLCPAQLFILHLQFYLMHAQFMKSLPDFFGREGVHVFRQQGRLFPGLLCDLPTHSLSSGVYANGEFTVCVLGAPSVDLFF